MVVRRIWFGMEACPPPVWSLPRVKQLLALFSLPVFRQVVGDSLIRRRKRCNIYLVFPHFYCTKRNAFESLFITRWTERLCVVQRVNEGVVTKIELQTEALGNYR